MRHCVAGYDYVVDWTHVVWLRCLPQLFNLSHRPASWCSTGQRWTPPTTASLPQAWFPTWRSTSCPPCWPMGPPHTCITKPMSLLQRTSRSGTWCVARVAGGACLVWMQVWLVFSTRAKVACWRHPELYLLLTMPACPRARTHTHNNTADYSICTALGGSIRLGTAADVDV